jgi:hypothetical protein
LFFQVLALGLTNFSVPALMLCALRASCPATLTLELRDSSDISTAQDRPVSCELKTRLGRSIVIISLTRIASGRRVVFWEVLSLMLVVVIPTSGLTENLRSCSLGMGRRICCVRSAQPADFFEQRLGVDIQRVVRPTQERMGTRGRHPVAT